MFNRKTSSKLLSNLFIVFYMFKIKPKTEGSSLRLIKIPFRLVKKAIKRNRYHTGNVNNMTYEYDFAKSCNMGSIGKTSSLNCNSYGRLHT